VLSKTFLARVLALTTVLTAVAWAAPKYKVLHAFGMGKDGGGLWASLALDAKGNLYGTTSGGGAYGDGTVFQLSPQANETWTETILHSFPSSSDDGGSPDCTPVLDSAGNLYGSTEGGGGPYTYGVVFELTPGSDDWKESFVYRFGKGDQANGPYGGVIMDGPDHLYGVGGAAFELSRQGNQWHETILHTFSCTNGDGCGTLANPVLAKDGSLYGPTQHGGTSRNCGGGCGTVYRLHRTSDGAWKETIIHDFGITDGDGALPGVGALFLDKSGSLYGTTDVGYARGSYGTVYRLTPSSGGKWTETILYSFSGGSDGDEPSAGVVGDGRGNLYGITIAGGTYSAGVVYKLSPRSKGKWKYTLLHMFGGPDGAAPDANLIFDSKGNLYGTTATGGAGGAGVAFEITP